MTRRLKPEEMAMLKALPEINQRKAFVQDLGLLEWGVNNSRGTMELATGVGKTRIGVLAAKRELEKNPDAVVYVCVPTTTLRDTDWPNEFRAWGAGDIVDKVKFVCHVSMDNIREEKQEIDLLIFDEVHNVTVTNFQVFKTHKVWKVLGLTATLPPADGYPSDLEKLVMVNSIAPSILKVTLDEAVELGLVADFDVYVMKFDLDNTDQYVDGGTKKKPFKTTEVRQYKYLTKMLQKASYGKPEMKFIWIQKRMQFLYTLRQKELLAREIMDAILKEKNGREMRTLIFCGGIEQADRLCGSDRVYHSKVPRPADQYLSLFQAKKIPYLGVCQALNEGKNIEALDQILVIQLNSKELDIIQRIGRTIRFREGHKARVIVLVAKGTVDEQWYKSAFENFDKKRIKEHYVKVTKPAQQPSG